MLGTRYWIRVTPPTLKAYTCKVVVYSHHPVGGFRGLLKPPIVGGYLGRPFGVPWRPCFPVDFLCGHLGAFCRLRSLTGGRVVSNVNPAGGRHRGSRRFLGCACHANVRSKSSQVYFMSILGLSKTKGSIYIDIFGFQLFHLR